MTEHTPPEHSGSMDTDRTGLHGGDQQPGPLADLDGEIGAEARRLVAALNPHPAQVAGVEQVVSSFVDRIQDHERDPDDTLQTLIGLRYTIETAVSRASAAPLMVPRGDQQGERVAGRAEPPTSLPSVFCGFHSLHPSHLHYAEHGTQLRCLGMDASGPRG